MGTRKFIGRSSLFGKFNKLNDAKQSINIDDDLFELGNVLQQVQALAEMTYGEPGESFRAQPEEIQDRVMWALSSLLDKAVDLHRRIEG